MENEKLGSDTSCIMTEHRNLAGGKTLTRGINVGVEVRDSVSDILMNANLMRKLDLIYGRQEKIMQANHQSTMHKNPNRPATVNKIL